MENNNWLQSSTSSYNEQSVQQPVVANKSFIATVFSYMTTALLASGATAWLFATSPTLLGALISEGGGLNLLGYAVMFAPFIMVLIMGFAYNRFSAAGLLITFFVYSILMGASLSFIFLAYTASSIALTFFITAATFGVMAVVGYTTQTDLTKLGGILTMALIGLVIAMVANWFMNSDTLEYIISAAGVVIFTGLTAYDVQKLKVLGAQAVEGEESTRKMAIMGALNLYLDFVNLFLFMLRFLGNRD